MRPPITAVLIGAGNRGTLYGYYARKNPQSLQFTAVAEPINTRLEKFSGRHGIPSKNRFRDWRDLLSKGKLADAAFICTQDSMHTGAVLQALEKGYHILLEKPMANRAEECIKIARKAELVKQKLAVCHVLRYTDFFKMVYDTIRSGRLGRIMNVNHIENIAWYHFSHSYVRGEWARREESSPVILAKCCHDLDLLYWLVGSPPARISSFGRLSHFKNENAPKGAPLYCVEGCPESKTCLYYAPRIYIENVPIIQIAEKSENMLFRVVAYFMKKHRAFLGFLAKFIKPFALIRYWRFWPVSYLYTGQREDYSDEGKWNVLKTSPYGRCVYRTDNDVVDHQVVSIEFENGVTADLAMHGFSEREGRTLRIDGTRATLIGSFNTSGEKIMLYDHYSGEGEVIHKKKLSIRGIPHGGGDFKLIDSFLRTLRTQNSPLTNAREILESHLMAFAADESRLSGKVVDMEAFRKKLGCARN